MTHPDFTKTSTLNATQTAWLAHAGIEARPGDRGYGFYFIKGDAWIEPIKATATTIPVLTRGTDEDGDDVVIRSCFRLRDALAALVAR